MFEIIISVIGIYLLVNMLLTDDELFAVVLTLGIVFIFFNIDEEKGKLEPKTETEIEQSLDKLHDGTLTTIEKVGELTEDSEKAFKRGQDKVKALPENKPVKIDLETVNFPAPQYLALDIRSDIAASMYKKDDNIYACTENNDCFNNLVIRTHVNNMRYICKGIEICYKAE